MDIVETTLPFPISEFLRVISEFPSKPSDIQIVVVAKHSGSLLSVEGSSPNDAANIVQVKSCDGDNQKFKLISCGDGYFNIALKDSTNSTVLVLNAFKLDSNIILHYSNGADSEKFKIDKA